MHAQLMYFTTLLHGKGRWRKMDEECAQKEDEGFDGRKMEADDDLDHKEEQEAEPLE